MAAQYAERIKAILETSDPNVATAKRIRKQLEEEHAVDLTPIKKDVDALILKIFDSLGDEKNGDNDAASLAPSSDRTPSAPQKEGPSTTKRAGYIPRPRLVPKAIFRNRRNGYFAPVKAPPALSELLGCPTITTRIQIQKLGWEYITANKLTDPAHATIVIPDEKLAVFTGAEPFKKMLLHVKLGAAVTRPSDEEIDKYIAENPIDDEYVDEDSYALSSEDDYLPPASRTAKVVEAPSLDKFASAASGKPPQKRKPRGHGFHKPHQLSDALSSVCGGLKILSRPKVVKMIWRYIKARNLQNPKDRREICCDDALKSVFSGKKKVTAFNMQKYITGHLGDVEGSDVVEDEIPDEDAAGPAAAKAGATTIKQAKAKKHNDDDDDAMDKDGDIGGPSASGNRSQQLSAPPRRRDGSNIGALHPREHDAGSVIDSTVDSDGSA
ncbi:hypothetical protein SeMB42_g04262 [Synchytrium endobioticum]|uniref:DM2 domain-containing protein n=1 Tax=Synchytrium endobioticum TaxID=286115 RepID=A0A507CVM9_9FUNG|nr:hypothetical protein SeLEV6574_g05172 [Synchytrium endobioticum]TPX44634.1 hypothetical protein SeMB42_g04262 [Synchytrium endobioticum]